jgi:hypothetical protein
MVYPRETAQASACAGFRRNAGFLPRNKRICSRVRLSNLQPGGRLPSPCNLQPQKHFTFATLLFLFAARLKHDLFEEDFKHSSEMYAQLSTEWMDYLADVAVEGM